MRDAPVLVDTREALIYLLSEAAEIEHGLMCCYLYAAYSLRRDDPRWNAVQRESVARWRSELLGVAREEMVHLALVSNLLNAVGGAPHLTRPNFPVWEGYHPNGVTLKLTPFSQASLDHFVFLERPENAPDLDGEGFEAGEPHPRPLVTGRLVPTAQDFITVGHLYRGIGDGFAMLAGQLGPRQLFIGNPALQIDSRDVGLPDLRRVVDLASAEAALETIVTQGEGLVQCDGHSHYRRFRQVRREFEQAMRDDPGFQPAWPAATNPVMRAPANPAERVHIVNEPAASLLDLANALYALTLRTLAALMSPHATVGQARGALSQLTGDSMRWLTPVAERLAELPATPMHPGVHAGMTFTMSRSLRVVPDRDAAFLGLAEACNLIAQRARTLEAAAPDALAPLALAMHRHCLTMRELARTPTAVPVARAAAAPPPKAQTEGFCGGARRVAQAPTADVQTARGQGIEIGFESKRCIHARHCVLDAPRVFLANTPGEWIKPDAMQAEDLAAVARNCPSGAITYRRLDGGPQEASPEVNTLRLRENGPLAIHAAMEIPGVARGFRATLCRCGQSANKPFCDGSHVAADFKAAGEPATISADPLPERDGPLQVVPTRDGPLRVTGNLEICAGTGRTILRTTATRLCRCGQSADKPFCDGSHQRAGFKAEGE
jgi:CDGSH-type Zn-finger protein/uncharacterized Fe-S cluster protein YjdI